jgi:hypothetical protein
MFESTSRTHSIGASARAGLAAMLLMASLLGGCAALTEPAVPMVLSSDMTTPRPLVAMLHLTLQLPCAVEVQYWSGDAPRLSVTSPRASQHDVPLLRLRAGRTYHYQVTGTDLEGTFSTPPLPADLAASIGAAVGSRSSPLVMLHLYQPGGFMGYAAVDQASEVVWYWRTVDFTFGMARRANGNFVMMDKGSGLVEVTPDGQLVRVLPQDLASREQHHDVIATAANTLLFIAFDDRTVAGNRVRGDAIWEWTPETGETVKRWSVWDHFTFADAPAPRGSGEWVHANALAIGPRGNILLGAHHWNQVLSITPDWQRTEWRMGGTNATSPVATTEEFSGQHTPREISTNHVVMFDNGVNRGGFSRAVEYVMDARGAHVVWEFRPQPANFASAVGSARRLPNGNTLVAFGLPAGTAGSTGPTEVYEASPDGLARWHLLVRTATMFRAEPLDAIGREVVMKQ